MYSIQIFSQTLFLKKNQNKVEDQRGTRDDSFIHTPKLSKLSASKFNSFLEKLTDLFIFIYFWADVINLGIIVFL